MIENRRGFDLFCHAVLIAGVVLIVFPVYVAFCAATMNAQEVFTVPLSLVPPELVVRASTAVPPPND